MTSVEARVAGLVITMKHRSLSSDKTDERSEVHVCFVPKHDRPNLLPFLKAPERHPEWHVIRFPGKHAFQFTQASRTRSQILNTGPASILIASRVVAELFPGRGIGL